MELRNLHLAAHDAFRKAKKVIVVSHPKPDGDTLGAGLAMLGWCEQEGIPAVGFCLDKIASQYGYLRGTERYTNDPAVFADPEVDLIAVFDAGDLRFAGIADAVARMPKKPVILNFDHHAVNDRFGDVNIVDLTSASTTEVVHRFFGVIGAHVPQPTANALLTGLLTDTGNFTNAATTTSSLGTGSSLIRRGAKMQEVMRHLVRNKSIPALRLWGEVFSRLKFDSDLGIATTAVFLSDWQGLEEDHVEGISNFLGRCLDCKAILVLKEVPGGKVKGSFRTVEDLDVSLPAKYLGGGGHKKASGFTIPGTIKETPEAWVIA